MHKMANIQRICFSLVMELELLDSRSQFVNNLERSVQEKLPEHRSFDSELNGVENL